MISSWDQLPSSMQNPAVAPYYASLQGKKGQLFLKRLGDLVLSCLLLVLFSPLILLLALLIKLDSPGPIFYRQERVTKNLKTFRIFKFRTMYVHADQKGALVTQKNDARITPLGRKIRKFRLDEIPQLINVFLGQMTFVGPRPEVEKYVAHYQPEMLASLLIPAGITCEASIRFRNEEEKLQGQKDPNQIYIEEILPDKMACNLEELSHFSLKRDLEILVETVGVLFRG